jgi:FeS assembly SUF system regulator
LFTAKGCAIDCPSFDKTAESIGEFVIRLSRLADYGVVLMTRIAQRSDGVHTAVDLAEASGLPVPTVSKVLATLARNGALRSVRGAHGGYALAGTPHDITVATIISAIDGPIALTQCIEDGPGVCGVENLCLTRRGWKLINQAVSSALEGVTLADIADAPMFPEPPINIAQLGDAEQGK